MSFRILVNLNKINNLDTIAQWNYNIIIELWHHLKLNKI